MTDTTRSILRLLFGLLQAVTYAGTILIVLIFLASVLTGLVTLVTLLVTT